MFLSSLSGILVHVSVLPAAMMLLAFKCGAFFNSFFNFHFSLDALDIDGVSEKTNLSNQAKLQTKS